MTGILTRVLEKKRTALIIIAVSMLFTVIHAQVGGGSYSTYSCQLYLSESALQTEICNIWQGMFPLALVAVLLSFAVAAIIFMIGVAAKIDRLRNFGIGELYEAVSTAIIIGAFFLLTGLLLQTMPQYIISGLGSAGGTTPTVTISDPYVVASNSLLHIANITEWSYDCIVNGDTSGGAGPWGGHANPPPTGFATCPFSSGENIGNTNFMYEAALTTQNNEVYGGVGVGGLGGALLNGAIGTGAFTLAIQAAELPTVIEYVLPQSTVTSFLVDGLYLLWGLYYLLMFFSVIGPVLVIIGVVFRAILPTRGLGGALIATGMGFYLVAPTILAFLFAPGANPYPSILNVAACAQVPVGIPATCSLFGTVLGIMNGLWLQIMFYPLLTVAITYSFITQMASFIGASASMGKMRMFL